MPSIQSLYDKIKNKDLAFVCISAEDEKTVSKFIREKGYTFPVHLYQGNLPSVYETQGIPATFIISKDGKIAFKHVGSAKWDDPKSIYFIQNLLK
jgi:peroxiredoxin